MSEYPPLILQPNQIFNLDLFTEENRSITLFDANLLYIKRIGDTVSGNFINTGLWQFNNLTRFLNDVEIHNKTLKMYNVSDVLVGSFNNLGEILTTKVNNVSALKITYLENITSDVQTQINSATTDLTTVKNRTSDMIAYNSGTTTSEFNNTVKANKLVFTTDINGIGASTFNYLSGCSSNIQTQIATINTKDTTQDGRLESLETATTQQTYTTNLKTKLK